jgi:hypothetical protein
VRAGDRNARVESNFVVIHGITPGDVTVEATGSDGRFVEEIPGAPGRSTA